jgi:hypothetical protein
MWLVVTRRAEEAPDRGFLGSDASVAMGSAIKVMCSANKRLVRRAGTAGRRRKGMKNRDIRLLCTFLLGLVVILPTQGRAGMIYKFYNITNNTPADVDVASQLTVEVTDLAPQVLFTFKNAGPIASSITDIYFDDGALGALVDLFPSGSGVAFTENAVEVVHPPDLPGGELLDPAFEATRAFSSDSDDPIMANGVNPGEYLGILFDLDSGETFNSVLSDLATGDLRIGLHVQAIGTDSKSDSFVSVVPLPASALLVVFAVGVAGRKLRKFV